MHDLRFNPLAAGDLMEIDRIRQPSQLRVMGCDGAMTWEEAKHHEGQSVGWCARIGDRPIACFGINETFPGVQGVGWAILSTPIGAAHLALTRFIRDRVILASKLKRIELFALARDAEVIVKHWPELDSAQLLAAVMAHPTRECAWANLLGLAPAHVLRKFGQASETFVLFERIN